MIMNDVKHVCCVDSVSDGIVRLLTGSNGEKAHFLPLELFPDGIKEGDWLNLIIGFDNDATEKGRQDVADLYKELGG
jgi:hypothetical protein